MGEAKGHQTGEKIVLELNSGSRLETGKGRWSTIPKRINFRKSSEGGGGLFSIQKFILQNLDLETGLFKHEKGLFSVNE